MQLVEFKLSLIKPLLTLSILGGISRALGFLAVVILVRLLRPEEYGQYVYFITLMAVGAELLNFRVYQALVREFNKISYSAGEKQSLINANLFLEISCGVLAAVLLLLFFYFSEGTPDLSSSSLITLIFLGIGVVAQYFGRGLMNGFHAMNQMSLYGLCDALPQFVFIALVILLYFLNEIFPYEANTVLAFKSISYLVAGLVLVYGLYKLVKALSPNRSDVLRYVRSLISMSFFPLMTGWLAIAYYQADRIMLKWLRDNPSEIGILHNAMLLGILITFFTSIFSKVIYPDLAEVYDKKGNFGIKPIIDRFNEFVFQVILPICLALHFFSQTITDLAFGQAYEESALLFSIWILFVAFTVSLGPGLHLLYLSKQQHFLTVGMAMGVLTNIVLNLILIPKYGPLGAVYATGAGTVVNVGFAHYRVAKTVTYNPLKQTKSKVFLLLCIVVFLLGQVNTLASVFGLSMLFLASYGAVGFFGSTLLRAMQRYNIVR